MKPGRPAKRTVAVVLAVLEAVRAGRPYSAAAAAAGIGSSTLHAWIAAGRRLGADPELAAFAAAVRQAREQGRRHRGMERVLNRFQSRCGLRVRALGGTEHTGNS
jgi:transposase-like protein